MIKQQIKEYFKDKKINYSGVNKFLKSNEKISKVLDRIVSKQPEWESKTNYINAIVNNIELKHCKICNNFIPFTKRRADFCSRECMYKDHTHYDKNTITKLQKYGSATYNNREKSKQTNLEKYGVDNPAKADEIKEKIKNTNLKKYGVKHAFQAESVKEKIHKTKTTKYEII